MTRQYAALVQDALTAYQHYCQVLRGQTLSALLTCGLSLRQVQALVFLAQQDTACVSTLASQLGLGRPSASVLVDSLVQRGLASRCDDPADRRRVVLRLTAAGVTCIDRLWQGEADDVYETLASLQPADLAALCAGLQMLTAIAAGQDCAAATTTGTPIYEEPADR